MNITPNDVYWVLQLDQIHEAIVGVILFMILAFIGLFVCIMSAISDEVVSRFVGSTVLFIHFLVVLLLFGVMVFLPTTRTALAMYVVPKIADSEVVEKLQGDAKELYTLGVERLKVELKGRNVK